MSIADLHDVRSFPSYRAPRRRRAGPLVAGLLALATIGVMTPAGLVSASPAAPPVAAGEKPAPAIAAPVAPEAAIEATTPAPRKVRVIPLYNVPGQPQG